MSTSEAQPGMSQLGGRGVGTGRRRHQRSGADHPTTPPDPVLDGPVDPESAARAIVLNKLTGQPRTRAELADTLAGRGIPDDVSARVLERFGEVGLVDDAAFATAWVESRHAGRGLARRALAHELRRRGVEDDVVDEAMESLDADREVETARALVRRRLSRMQRADRAVTMRRLLGMLARKGYPSGVAITVVREALEANEEDLPLVDESALDAD